MLPKGQVNFLLLPLLVLAGVFLTAARPPTTYCRNCEEEIWEEVPCRSVATPPSTTTTVRPPTTAVPPTTVAVAAAASTKLPAGSYASAPSTFKQCYCDCKVGCREFCRKVFVSSQRDDIKQVVHSCSNANGGRYETKHSHECKFITSPKKPPHPVYTAEHKDCSKGPNPPPGNAYDLKVLTGGGPLPAKSQTGPLKNPHEDYIFEDIERLLHQNEKQTENLDFYGSAGGNELPYFGGDKEAYAKAAPARPPPPPKGKSNYILTKSNEGAYRQAIDNYLKDYGGNEVGSNAFQAAYSVSYE